VKLVILPQAQDELQQAAVFYIEQASIVLGEAFINEFERSTSILLATPHIGSIWRSGTRRFSLHRFPYSIIYQVKPDLLRVVAVAHQSRRPGYWAKRK
jgi:toxin ParE1/3/4